MSLLHNTTFKPTRSSNRRASASDIPKVDPLSSTLAPLNTEATTGQWNSRHTLSGCGVAIFHIATKRVVICHHPQYNYWFLPKGRRDAGEQNWEAAQREGFEESGYRNRLLPLPIHHYQPSPYDEAAPRNVIEPVWTTTMPLRTLHYITFWYVGETLPPDVEERMNELNVPPTQAPPACPPDLNLYERVRAEPQGYTPPHHAGMGVDSDEQQFESHLLPIPEAIERLGVKTVLADIVRVGWKAICRRMEVDQIAAEVAGHFVT